MTGGAVTLSGGSITRNLLIDSAHAVTLERTVSIGGNLSGVASSKLVLANGSTLLGNPQVATNGFEIEVADSASVTLAGLSLSTSAALNFDDGDGAQTLNLSAPITIVSGSTLTIDAGNTPAAIVGQGATRVAIGTAGAKLVAVQGNSDDLSFENVQFAADFTLELNDASVSNALIPSVFVFNDGGAGNASGSGVYTDVTFSSDVFFRSARNTALNNNNLTFGRDVIVTGGAVTLSGGSITRNLILDGNGLSVDGTLPVNGGLIFKGESALTLNAGSILSQVNVNNLGGTTGASIIVGGNATLSSITVNTSTAISLAGAHTLGISALNIGAAPNEVIITLGNASSKVILSGSSDPLDGTYSNTGVITLTAITIVTSGSITSP